MGLNSQLSGVITAIGSDIKYLTNRDVDASKVKGSLNVDSISASTISGTTFYGDGSKLTGISSLAGSNNTISSGTTSSGIFAGTSNRINTNVSRSVILGGSNIVATKSDTVYVPNLNIQTVGTGSSVYNLAIDGEGNVVSGLTSNIGKIGISNTSGEYTYYNSLQQAIDSANSGDTLELFSNITETSNISIILKDGININGNGHIYILDSSGTTSAFVDGGTTTRKDVYIFNLIIKRVGGTNSLYNSLSMYINGNTTVYCNDVWLISSFGTGLCVYGDENKPAKVVGVKINSQVNGANIGGSVVSGELKSSHVISNTGIGINVGLGRLFDCIGESTSGYGIYNGGEIYNCKGISNTNYGINSTYNGGLSIPKTFDSTSVSYSTISMYLDGEIYGCIINCEWDDSNGHGIRIVSNNSIISNCNIIVKNQYANCMYSSSAINVKYNNNTLKGSNIGVHSNITQGIINVSDNQGNIVI